MGGIKRRSILLLFNDNAEPKVRHEKLKFVINKMINNNVSNIPYKVILYLYDFFPKFLRYKIILMFYFHTCESVRLINSYGFVIVSIKTDSLLISLSN